MYIVGLDRITLRRSHNGAPRRHLTPTPLPPSFGSPLIASRTNEGISLRFQPFAGQ